MLCLGTACKRRARISSGNPERSALLTKMPEMAVTRSTARERDCISSRECAIREQAVMEHGEQVREDRRQLRVRGS